MGQALYRKYRSKSLDEIVGQSHITDILRRAIAADRIAHAYLFTGPKGVGKTSIARILAHEINQLPYTDESTHLDIIEIDAASNNGVDDIRDLREKVQIAPTSARKKVYIIDEVHMLSKQAFNALLKTLEEPPEHIVFILATTDVDKLPPTIISRVQRFNFRAATDSDAAKNLRAIADAEQIAIDDEAIALIAHHGNGSFRDSVSLLDQLRSLSDSSISRELVESVLGLADADSIEQLLEAYQAGNLANVVMLLNGSESRGTPAIILAEQLIRTIRARVTANPGLLSLLDSLLEVSKSAWPHMKLLIALGNSPYTTQPATTPTPPETFPKTPPRPEPSVSTAPAPKKEKAAAAKHPTNAAASASNSEETEFPLVDFLAAMRKESIGAATLLSKCGFISTKDTLTIYAGKPFTKKQIEKSLTQLSAALQQVGIENAEITILAETKPAHDSKTASVLAIMGGGEVVSL